MRAFIVFVGLALLSGCMTSPITAQDASPVPKDRMYVKPGSGTAKLVLTRDSGFFGAACNHRVYIDGDLSAEIGSGEVAIFSLSPGKHIVSVKPSTLCGSGALVEREVDLESGKSVRRRVSIGPGGIDLSPTAF